MKKACWQAAKTATLSKNDEIEVGFPLWVLQIGLNG